MYFSVAEALNNFECLSRVKLVAGEKGLKNKIKGVDIMEVPQVARWMKGGELLLTAAFAIKKSPEIMESLIPDLVEKNVACLGIKPGQYVNVIPEKIIRDANKYNLPVLEIPRDLAYKEIMVPLMEKIMNNQLNWMRKERKIHDRLMEALLSGSGFEGICGALVELVDSPVFILDSMFELIASAYPEDPGAEPVPELDSRDFFLNYFPELVSAQPQLNKVQKFGEMVNDVKINGIYIPVPVQDRLGGYLIVIDHNDGLNKQKMVAANYASLVTAVEFSKREAIMNKENQIKGELVEDLIFGDYHSRSAMQKRLHYFGFELKHPLTVLIIQIEEYSNLQNENQFRTQDHKKNIINMINNFLHKYSGELLMQSKSSRLIVILENNEQDKDLDHYIEEIIAAARNRYGIEITVGIGNNVTEITDISNSYEQAIEALHLGSKLQEDKSFYYFDELGPYRFLFNIKDNKKLHEFYRNTIGKLIKYDEEEQMNLCETLEQYFANNCNARKTADEMYIHRNTLLYRLKRIEEITGMDLQNHRNKFYLEMALFVKPIVAGKN